jgi:hypothetical protein
VILRSGSGGNFQMARMQAKMAHAQEAASITTNDALVHQALRIMIGPNRRRPAGRRNRRDHFGN